MTSFGYIIVNSCIISLNLNCILQLKQFYNIATKVSCRKKCYYFWWSTWLNKEAPSSVSHSICCHLHYRKQSWGYHNKADIMGYVQLQLWYDFWTIWIRFKHEILVTLWYNVCPYIQRIMCIVRPLSFCCNLVAVDLPMFSEVTSLISGQC